MNEGIFFLNENLSLSKVVWVVGIYCFDIGFEDGGLFKFCFFVVIVCFFNCYKFIGCVYFNLIFL